MEETFTYDDMNRLTGITLKRPSGQSDNLGSWVTITDANGTAEQQMSFDAWGNRRDPQAWANYTASDVLEEPMFDRGFTGHEHLYSFGLVNMNGRMYDPAMSSFLSPDRYVQNPWSAQGFNRYAYCMYNPLRLTDPTGWLAGGGGGHNGQVAPELFGLPSTVWFLGGKQVTYWYTQTTIIPMIEQGINPGLMEHQPFK